MSYLADPYDSSRGGEYLDEFKRPGNMFLIRMVLPKPVAEAVAKKLRVDPTFIRRVSEAYVRTRYSQKFQETTWDRFGKPPYEIWDEIGPRRMVIVDALSNLQDKSVPLSEIESKIVQF